MTEILRLKGIGNYGINSDINPWELGPEYITEGRNFRVRNGSIRPFGSFRHLQDAPPYENEVGFLKFIRVAPSGYWVQASRRHIHVISNNGSSWKSIGSHDYGLANHEQYEWTGTQLGKHLVLSNPHSNPESWLEGQELMEPLIFRPIPDTDPVEFETWEDLGYSCRAMRTHKSFLIALGINDEVDSPSGYRISTAADINGLPYTWDTDDRSGIAIRAQLGGSGGAIVDGLSLGDSFIIYSENAIDSISFNPSSEFYWTRREQSSSTGLLNPNSLVEVSGKHYFIGDGDIFINDGTNIQSLLYGRLQQRFNSSVNEFTKTTSYVVRNDVMKEIWFCVPENESVLATTAYIYNWQDNSWSIRDLPHSVAHSDYGTSVFEPGEFFWGSNNTTWAEQEASWSDTRSTADNDILVGIYSFGGLGDLDPIDGDVDGDIDSVIERVDFPLLDNRGNVTITRCYPMAIGAPFEIQFGSQQQAEGPVSWQPYQRFTPGVDRKVDFRSTGELLCWRVKSIGSDRFKLSGLEIEYVPSGLR